MPYMTLQEKRLRDIFLDLPCFVVLFCYLNLRKSTACRPEMFKFVEGFYLLICKVCGTANSPDSSVCAKCGEKLRVNQRPSTKKKKSRNNHKIRRENKAPEEIYSTSKRIESKESAAPSRDVFSSDEAYEKVRKDSVLEKIHELEEEIGDTSQPIEEEQVEQKIVPKVINRTTSNDIIRSSQPQKNQKDKKHDIPRRVINSVQNPDVGKRLSTKSESTSEQKKDNEQPGFDEAKTEKKTVESAAAENKSGETEKKSASNDRPANSAAKKRRRKKPSGERHDSVTADERKKTAVNAERVTEAEEIPSEAENTAVSAEKTTVKTPEESLAENLAEEIQVLSNVKTGKIELPKDDPTNVAAVKPRKVKKVVKHKKPAHEKKEENAAEISNEDNIEGGKPNAQPQKKEPEITEVNTAPNVLPSESPTVETSDAANGENAAAESIISEEKTEKATADYDSESAPRKKKSADSKTVKRKKKKVPVETSKAEKSESVSVSDSGEAEVKKVNSEKTSSESEPKKKKKKTPKTSAPKPESGETEENKPKQPKKKTDIPKKSTSKKKRFDESDISANKYLAALSYLGVLIIIPFMKRKDSPFCKAHVRQGAAVLLWTLCISLATLIIVLGLRALVLWVFALSAIVYKVIALAVAAVMLTLIFIPVFEGAVGAFSGMYKQVTFVGKFVKHNNK